MTGDFYISSHFSIRPSVDGEPDYKSVIPNANMRRRMGRIVKMGVAACAGCLGKVPGRVPDAVLTASALGCLNDTEKFACEILDREETMLNPTAFIFSTFNTLGGQIALLDSLKTYNSTYVNGASSFSDALLDALLLVSEGHHNVLVLAFDEIIPTSRAILERMGRFSPESEGAVAFLISDSPSECCPCRISSFSLSAATVQDNRPMLYESIESAFLLEREVTGLVGSSVDSDSSCDFADFAVPAVPSFERVSRKVAMPSSGTSSAEVSLPSLDIVIERV